MTKVALIVGTVYGAAEYVGEQAQALLKELGYQTMLFTEAKLDDVLSFNADIWLVISSTTGQGDIPDNLLPFYLDVQNRFPLLTGSPTMGCSKLIKLMQGCSVPGRDGPCGPVVWPCRAGPAPKPSLLSTGPGPARRPSPHFY